MSGQKIVSLIEERAKLVRHDIDEVYDSLEFEIAELRDRFDELMRRIELLEKGRGLS